MSGSRVLAPASLKRAPLLALLLWASVNSFAQAPFGQELTDVFSPDWPERYLLWQQRSLFPPMPSPKGLMEHPAVLGVQELNRGTHRQTMADDLIEQSQRPQHHRPPTIDVAERNASRNPQHRPAPDAHDELRQLVQDLNEAAATNKRMASSGHYASIAYREDIVQYEQAYEHLAAMLDCRTPPSIADGVYTAEAAYGKLPFSREAFQQEIARSADFIRRWLRENRLDARDQEALHLGIQRFMGDTLSLRGDRRADAGPHALPPLQHMPFAYDYLDCRGEQDPRNLFLTKALATGTGQCANLPLVYLVLAEALGAQAHLSFAPQHSFIKYRNNAGAMQNYETTVHWHLSDNEYMEHMPVMAEALASGVYLHPLSQRQTIAAVLIDLAYQYKRKHGPANGRFLLKCVDRGLREFPNGEARGLYLRGGLLAARLDLALHRAGINDLERINEDPAANAAHAAYRANARRIAELGIQPFPEAAYRAMLEKHDARGRLQQARGFDTKARRSLFTLDP